MSATGANCGPPGLSRCSSSDSPDRDGLRSPPKRKAGSHRLVFSSAAFHSPEIRTSFSGGKATISPEPIVKAISAPTGQDDSAAMPGELSSTRALGPFKKETIGKLAMEAFVAGEPASNTSGVASTDFDMIRPG